MQVAHKNTIGIALPFADQEVSANLVKCPKCKVILYHHSSFFLTLGRLSVF
jgi:hypothetical protein